VSRAFVIHPALKQPQSQQARHPDACLEEAIGLAHAIDLVIADAIIVPLAKITSATLLGSGKIEELKSRIKETESELVIINHSLSPIQQRNLEKAWEVKVIDRTALILEIFGARARTHEGKLQVELAALDYQKGRLVRSWTHLERQRGGFGFLGGPGESQIEIDRRLIRDRMAKLKKQLEQVARTRELHRKTRRETPFPVVALVGYTNAGKSTLFNRLTGANVLSMDKLFATLDPTMRQMNLPGGGKIILSDTVGFVSDLPTELVAAFRATLEEVLEADILLHIRDISHPDSEMQKRDVEEVLKALFKTAHLPENVVEVYNKIDLLPPLPLGEGWGEGPSLSESESKSPHPNPLPRGEGKIRISAVTGEGIDQLLAAVNAEMAKGFFTSHDYTLSLEDGKSLAWLHAHGKVMAQDIENEYIHVTVQLSEENACRFESIHHVESRS